MKRKKSVNKKERREVSEGGKREGDGGDEARPHLLRVLSFGPFRVLIRNYED